MGFAGSPISILPWIALHIALPLMALLLLALSRDPVCEAYGSFATIQACAVRELRRLMPMSVAAPLICTRCSQGLPPRTQLQKEQIKLGRKFLAILLVITLLAAYFVPDFVGAHFGIRYWIALPLAIVATMVGVPAVGFVILVLRLAARFRRLSDERFVLANARKAAGEEGQVLEKGSATCWYTGPVAAVELVMAQMEPTAQPSGIISGKRDRPPISSANPLLRKAK